MVPIAGAVRVSVRSNVIRLVVAICFVGVAQADDESQRPLSNAADSSSRLLFVVTDDDFLVSDQSVWCQDSLQASINAVRDQRRATYLMMETRRAGEPSLLRGGRTFTSGPHRVICFLCDGERRILSCCVGIPNSRQLLSFSEDADELAVSMALAGSAGLEKDTGQDTEQATPLADMVRDRASNRVTRHYRPLLLKMNPSLSIEKSSHLLAEALTNDIKERFLFDSPIESERWVSAQQHAEARRHWCDTMLVGFVGKQVDDVWPEFTVNVWGALPWHGSETVQQFATECSETLQQHGIVLELDLTKRYVQAEFTNVSASGLSATSERSGTRREAALARALETAQVRTCNLCELAWLWKSVGQSPIQLRNPKTRIVRWIVLKSVSAEPVLLPDGAENRLIDLISSLRP